MFAPSFVGGRTFVCTKDQRLKIIATVIYRCASWGFGVLVVVTCSKATERLMTLYRA